MFREEIQDVLFHTKILSFQESHEATEAEYNALLISYGKDSGKGKVTDEPNQQVDDFHYIEITFDSLSLPQWSYCNFSPLSAQI